MGNLAAMAGKQYLCAVWGAGGVIKVCLFEVEGK